jgi:hypothetical protein
LGGNSCTSIALITRWSTMHPVTPTHLPLAVLSDASTSDLTMVPLSSSQPMVAPQETLVLGELALEVQAVPVMPMPDGSSAPLLQDAQARVELGVDGTPLGTVSTEADGADSRLGDDVVSLLRDLVVRGTGLGTPRRIDPSDAIPALGSSGIGGLGITRLLLLGTPDSSSPSIEWRQVEDNVEYACSQVTVVKRLLREALASVGQNILHLIQVSLKKKEGDVCVSGSGTLRVLSFPPAFVSASPILG